MKKAELFSKVRSGQVRLLLGSTAKMGAGTNVQDRLIALHHLDVPWKPADIEQQEGRILRQGNGNAKVHIFRYVTEGTFDAYSWQIIENKQKFISQIMTSKSPVRSCEDVDAAELSTVRQQLEDAKAESGKPFPKEAELKEKVARLQELNAILNLDERGSGDLEPEENAEPERSKPSIHDRLKDFKESVDKVRTGPGIMLKPQPSL